MGGNTEIDLEEVRQLAQVVEGAADHTNEMVWSTDHLTAVLPGSAVSRIEFASRTTAHVDALVAAMAAWVAQTRGAADALERTDVDNASRLPR